MMTDMVLFYIKTSKNKVVFIFKIDVTNDINSEILNKILLGKKNDFVRCYIYDYYAKLKNHDSIYKL